MYLSLVSWPIITFNNFSLLICNFLGDFVDGYYCYLFIILKKKILTIILIPETY